MTKRVALLLLTPALITSVGASLMLMLPYGMAEPGQPHGWGFEALAWSIGESVWTWWVFARGKFRGRISAHSRWEGTVIVLILVVLSVIIGLKLQARQAWEASAWTSAVLTTAGCRLGRWRLHTGSAVLT